MSHDRLLFAAIILYAMISNVKPSKGWLCYWFAVDLSRVEQGSHKGAFKKTCWGRGGKRQTEKK